MEEGSLADPFGTIPGLMSFSPVPLGYPAAA